MENEENRKKGAGRGLIILAVVVIAFLIYYSIMSMLAPSRKMDEIKAEYGAGQKEKGSADQKYGSDSAYISLLKEKAFLQSGIAMAGTDSIYITLDIPDSTANLEISGVTVHSAKMKKIRVSRILRSGNEDIIYNMLSSPLNIVRDYSSIRKMPLMVKMAPKDTSEYKPDIIPDTSDTKPVNYILEMNNGIRIFVYQSKDTAATFRKAHFIFDLRDRLRNTMASLKSVMTLKVPEYHPFIKIELPKSDAKILYRAVPKNGQIAINL